ncbi:MAG TPA: hypothetical protein VFV52_06330 [Bacilli bacterium]|nr:hypothetical protein [Bacilli bacterium]
MDEKMQPFECPACGQEVKPQDVEGEKGMQHATCSSCRTRFARTFAWFKGEWVFGLWRNEETGKVACTYYKTVAGTHAVDCE